MAGKQLGKADAEMQINFSALKKHDQSIQHIIDTASSVAHYKFNSSSGVWEKTEVEGSLFLYSRKTSPYVIIFIMNRLNKDNAKLTLTQDMEFKIQEPFLLCKASNSEIIGIWFYDCAECRRFGALLNRFRALAKDERSLQISIMMEAQKNAKAQESSSNGIIGMFTQAQDEYTKSRSKFQEKTYQKGNANQSQKKDQNKRNKVVLHRGISEPNLRAGSPSNNRSTESEEKSPLNDKDEQMRKQQEKFKEGHKKEQEMLFNILHGNNKTHHKRPVSSGGGDFDTGGGRELNLSSNLMSNAGDLATCNELEKNFISNHRVKEKAIDCAELESQFTKQIKGEGLINHVDVLNKISNPSIIGNNRSDDLGKTRAIDNKLTDAQLSYPSLSPVGVPLKSHSMMEGIKSSKPNLGTESGSIVGSWQNSPITTYNLPNSNASTGASANITSDLSNHLLSPHVMTSSKGRGTTLSTLANGQQNVALAANFKQVNKINKKSSDTKSIFPEAPSGAALKSLMAPAAFQLTSPNVGKNGDTSNMMKNGDTIISKKEFQTTLLSLIQTDNEFVTKLHNAFLEKLQQR